MKLLKYILFFTCFLHFSDFYSQKPRVKNLPTHDDRVLHFGFNIGLNTMDFGIINSDMPDTAGHIAYADVYNLQPGFHVSIVSNLRLNKYMDLRFLPGIAFGQREIYFIDDIGQPLEPAVQKLNSSYIDFPLLVKYKAERINNFRPYLITGGNIRIDLAAKKDFEEDKDLYLKLKSLDYYCEIGFGFDTYLQFFKLSTEIKYSIGLRNIKAGGEPVSRPEYVRAIDQIFSRIIMLSFYFE